MLLFTIHHHQFIVFLCTCIFLFWIAFSFFFKFMFLHHLSPFLLNDFRILSRSNVLKSMITRETSPYARRRRERLWICSSNRRTTGREKCKTSRRKHLISVNPLCTYHQFLCSHPVYPSSPVIISPSKIKRFQTFRQREICFSRGLRSVWKKKIPFNPWLWCMGVVTIIVHI